MRFVLAFLVLVTVVWADPLVRVEFRPASDEPGPGLSEISGGGQTLYVEKDPLITNRHVARATAGRDSYTGQPVVNVLLTEEGGEIFAAFTADNIGRPVAILVDGNLVSAPRIMESIPGGQVVISGNFTEAEAERIAMGIRPSADPGR